VALFQLECQKNIKRLCGVRDDFTVTAISNTKVELKTGHLDLFQGGKLRVSRIE
jgi:hypothetical protein